jgi:DNA-binding NarL/FixJ family response regulator
VPTKSPVRVLLVGDRPVVLAGLLGIVDADHGMRVVGEARSVSEALKKIRETDAEVIVTCTPLVDGSSAAIVKRVKSAQPGVAAVALALHDDAKLGEEMIRAGAVSCLPPTADRRSVLDAVRAAVGQPRALRHVDGSSTAPPNSPLSRRELQVLTLIAEGNTNKQIAEELGISVRTVETHRERVMRKLNAQGTAALTKWAISLGLVTPGE